MGLILEELLIGDSPEMITNPFSGEFCILPPLAVAVYDYIQGCLYLNEPCSDALEYFRERWPDEYYILLD